MKSVMDIELGDETDHEMIVAWIKYSQSLYTKST